jgi:hypothetical protein
MNWNAVGAIGEILGALAVFISLVYLASQIRANTLQSRASMAAIITVEQSRLLQILGDPGGTISLADPPGPNRARHGSDRDRTPAWSGGRRLLCRLRTTARKLRGDDAGGESAVEKHRCGQPSERRRSRRISSARRLQLFSSVQLGVVTKHAVLIEREPAFRVEIGRDVRPLRDPSVKREEA